VLARGDVHTLGPLDHGVAGAAGSPAEQPVDLEVDRVTPRVPDRRGVALEREAVTTPRRGRCRLGSRVARRLRPWIAGRGVLATLFRRGLPRLRRRRVGLGRRCSRGHPTVVGRGSGRRRTVTAVAAAPTATAGEGNQQDDQRDRDLSCRRASHSDRQFGPADIYLRAKCVATPGGGEPGGDPLAPRRFATSTRAGRAPCDRQVVASGSGSSSRLSRALTTSRR
jgi:hypothetical protein